MGVFDCLNGINDKEKMMDIVNEINNEAIYEKMSREDKEQNNSRIFTDEIADAVCMVGKSTKKIKSK